MKRWHLYLDESGTFNAKKDDGKTPEYNLVGGFMLPEKDGEQLETHKPLVEEWVNEVVASAQGMFRDAADYDFLHCSENKGKWEQRKKIQPFLLTGYRDRILAAQGRVVIFDGGRQLADVDNTSTFLSVLTKGVIRLYHALEAEERDNRVELVLHCARRTPHGKEYARPIPDREYKNAMKHIAFLLCEYYLRPDTDNPFHRTVDGMEIILPDKHQQNPLTSVCDCLCNTYQHVNLNGTRDSGWGAVFDQTYSLSAIPKNERNRRCMIFDTTQSANIGETDLNRMVSDRTYVPMLMRILNRKKPEPELVRGYFDRLNAAPESVQGFFVTELIERLKMETQDYYRDSFTDVSCQIGRVVDLLEKNMMNRELLTEVCANAHLFLLAMHTHAGQDDQVQRDMTAFLEVLPRMRDVTKAFTLKMLYYNRLLVFQTDRFEFKKVETDFNKLAQSWQSIFGLLGLSAVVQENACAEYGREIGSYLQMLRFRVRYAGLKRDGYLSHLSAPALEALLGGPEVDFDCLCELARKYGQEGSRHLAGEDLSRLHQTMCDVEAEMGDFDCAFRHLYAAAMLKEHNSATECAEPFGTQEMDAILGAAWKGRMDSPFIYYHFVRLMHELAIRRDDRAKAMLARIPRNFVPETFGSTMADDMRVGIKWKLGSTLVRVGEEDRGRMFMNSAVTDALSLGQRPYDAIALAAACERVALGVGSNRDVPGIYAGFLEKTRAVGAGNPFAEVLPEEGVPNVPTCALAARMIAY